MEKITDQIERLDELETLVADFIELNRELVNENRVLEKQKKLILSNSDLERRAEEARSRVSKVIERLQKHSFWQAWLEKSMSNEIKTQTMAVKIMDKEYHVSCQSAKKMP